MIGYIRVSDINKSDGESQREAIKDYATRHNLAVSEWVEESVSASKTDLADRKLASIISAQQSFIASDITRLGRNKVMSLIGAIGEIASYGELHLAYNDTVINAENVDNAEVIFTVVGQSFASAIEAQKRSERAKAGHAKRKARGLSSGRKKGQKVKSKLDEHTAFILNLMDKNTPKTKVLKKLRDKGVVVSRSRFYSWLEDRGLRGKKSEYQNELF